MASATQGWDLVAVINQSTLNGLLADAFSTTTPVSTSVPNVGSFVGTFGTPTINLSPSNAVGTNTMASLILPISGTITFNGTPYTLASGATITFTANLSYVSLSGTDQNSSLALSLDWSSDLLVYNVSLSGLSTVLDDILAGLLTAFLQTQASTTDTYAFGTISVAAIPTALQPTGTAEFAIQTNSSPDQNALALLMLTSSGTQPTNPPDFTDSAALLPSGQSSALYISNRVLMEELVGPQLGNQLGVGNAWSTSSDGQGDYTLSFSGSATLPNPPSGIHQISVTSVTANVNTSNQINVAYTANAYPSFNVDDGYWIEITGSLTLEPTLDATTQAISFSVNAPTPSGSLKATPLMWAVVVAAIIASFGTVGAFIGGIILIVVPILATYLSFPITAMSGMAASIQGGIAQVQWPAQQAYPLNSLSLPADLVLYGNISS